MAIAQPSAHLLPDNVATPGLPPGMMSSVPEMPAVAPPINVHHIIERIAHDLRRQLAAKRIALNMKLSARGYLVAGDHERMRQIYTNLLSNAVTYARKGGHITVRSSCPTPDAIRVEVSHS